MISAKTKWVCFNALTDKVATLIRLARIERHHGHSISRFTLQDLRATTAAARELGLPVATLIRQVKLLTAGGAK